MLTFYSTLGYAYEVPSYMIWMSVISSLIMPIALYVLRSIGLYTLARRRNIKHAILAVFPCLWFYIVCQLVREVRIFKTTIGKLAILFTVLFSLSQILTFVIEFFDYFPLVGNFLAGREIVICSEEKAAEMALSEYAFLPGSGIWVHNSGIHKFVNPYGDFYHVFLIIYDVIYYLSMPLDLVCIVMEVTVLMNLFRKFWPQRFVFAFIMSVFLGLSGLFIFLIRNKEPVNYNDYIRAQYQQYGPYGYSYGPRGPYNPYANRTQQPKSPFEDYADPKDKEPEDPFSDYDKK